MCCRLRIARSVICQRKDDVDLFGLTPATASRGPPNGLQDGLIPGTPEFGQLAKHLGPGSAAGHDREGLRPSLSDVCKMKSGRPHLPQRREGLETLPTEDLLAWSSSYARWLGGVRLSSEPARGLRSRRALLQRKRRTHGQGGLRGCLVTTCRSVPTSSGSVRSRNPPDRCVERLQHGAPGRGYASVAARNGCPT